MKLRRKFPAFVIAASVLAGCSAFAIGESGPADTIILHARVITVDNNFSVAEAVAVRGGTILAAGTDREMERYKDSHTRVIDAHGNTVMPGIYDSHVHSYNASVSELDQPLPVLHSIAEAQKYIRKQAEEKPKGSWIILERVYPTRLYDGRLPTLQELDEAAPDNPVYWNSGPVSMANTRALEISHITNSIPDPPNGEVVRDPETGRLTGLLRNAANLLAVPSSNHMATTEEHREALKHLYALYNEQGITSIGERRAEKPAIDLFRAMAKEGELTVRINCTRVIELGKTVSESIDRLNDITNCAKGDLPYGPTGVGDDWVRIGPLKTFMDGGMLIGTAYMRAPWGVGDTYQISNPAYRGILYQDSDMLDRVYLDAAKRGWQLTSHCAGDAAIDVLLNTYQRISFKMDISQRRFLVTHGNFPSEDNWQRYESMHIGCDMQPAWLYKDADSLLKTLGPKRMRLFLPFKTMFDKGIMIGGGSDHMVKLDSMDSTNPWNPWLGMWIALTRQTERGNVFHPEECLTRQQAIKFYTINNAWLNFEETKKGSLQPGKLADLIMIDRDILKCPVDDVKSTKVLLTMVGGKTVWEAK